MHSSLGEVWMPEFLTDVSARREVFLPAHPGFGESTGMEEIADIEDLAFHYCDFMDEILGVGTPVDLVGVSFGGWIAAEVAVRWPERLRSLTLIDPVGIWVPEHPISPIWGIERDEMARLLFEDLEHPLARMILAVDLDDPPPEEVLLPFISSQAATAKIAWNPYMHNPKLAGRLRRIKAPTLFVWGENDRLVSPQYGERYASLIPGARFETVPGGHMCCLERPGEVGGLLDNFIPTA